MSTETSGLRRLAVSAFVCLLLPACAGMGASSQPLPTVAVDPHVVMPKDISYLSKGQVWGQAVGAGVGGLSGMAVGSAISDANRPPDEFVAKLEATRIDVGAILVEEMRKALAAKTDIRLVDHDADMVVQFTVTDYGFVSKGFSDSMTVVLSTEDRGVLKTGKVSFHGSNGPNHAATNQTMDQIFANPTMIEPLIRKMAVAIAADQARGVAYYAGQLTLDQPR